MNQKVDTYLEKVGIWQNELTLLRRIVLDCGLTEDFKWMHPCYTHQKKNIVILQEFKNFCAIMFQKGALLHDSEGILIKISEHVQAARQIRFTSIEEIEKLEPTIKAYVYEALEVEKAGLQVKMKKTSEFEVPGELKQIFIEDPAFESAFKNLTPGRQRGYLLHFSQPKQSKTRLLRIQNTMDRIAMGKGLRDCICGQSKRMPNCDGSHKHINNNS